MTLLGLIKAFLLSITSGKANSPLVDQMKGCQWLLVIIRGYIY